MKLKAPSQSANRIGYSQVIRGGRHMKPRPPSYFSLTMRSIEQPYVADESVSDLEIGKRTFRSQGVNFLSDRIIAAAQEAEATWGAWWGNRSATRSEMPSAAEKARRRGAGMRSEMRMG
jgi:hypothetical protein